MQDLLPKLRIELPEIEDLSSGKGRPNPLPLVGRDREGGERLGSIFDGRDERMAPSPNPSHKGRGTSPVLLDPFALFAAKPRQIELEIGFGGGEHLAACAAQRPDTGFIGCEPFINGVASLLGHIDNQKLENIRIYPNDARTLLDALPDACLARIFILFPDPWPKARHEKRRFIGPENLPHLARALQKGGEMHLATDDVKLAGWMFAHMDAAK